MPAAASATNVSINSSPIWQKHLVDLPLFQAAPSEVVVPAPDLRMVGFDGLPVVLALGFLVLAVHTKDLVIVHALNPVAIQLLPAPIAILNFKKSVSHCYNSFC